MRLIPLKKQINKEFYELQEKDFELETRIDIIENNKEIHDWNNDNGKDDTGSSSNKENNSIIVIQKINYQKWHVNVTLVVDNFKTSIMALVDSGADHNIIREGIVPTKYCDKTKEKLFTANNSPLKIKYKLSRAHICNNGYCFENIFTIVSDVSYNMILGTPFLTQIYPFLC